MGRVKEGIMAFELGLERCWEGFEFLRVKNRRAFQEGIKRTRPGSGKASGIIQK